MVQRRVTRRTAGWYSVLSAMFPRLAGEIRWHSAQMQDIAASIVTVQTHRLVHVHVCPVPCVLTFGRTSQWCGPYEEHSIEVGCRLTVLTNIVLCIPVNNTRRLPPMQEAESLPNRRATAGVAVWLQ
jgi:hypothetical protein